MIILKKQIFVFVDSPCTRSGHISKIIMECVRNAYAVFIQRDTMHPEQCNCCGMETDDVERVRKRHCIDQKMWNNRSKLIHCAQCFSVFSSWFLHTRGVDLILSLSLSCSLPVFFSVFPGLLFFPLSFSTGRVLSPSPSLYRSLRIHPSLSKFSFYNSFYSPFYGSFRSWCHLTGFLSVIISVDAIQQPF